MLETVFILLSFIRVILKNVDKINQNSKSLMILREIIKDFEKRNYTDRPTNIRMISKSTNNVKLRKYIQLGRLRTRLGVKFAI